MIPQKDIKEAAMYIKDADALFITAGAGIGVDSGLPDFRGNQGFWKAYPPIAKLGIPFHQMANPEWFHRNPGLAWAFYGHRLNLYRRTSPHNGFKVLLEISEKKRAGYFIFTSNVDGHFQKSGFDNEKIEECHGSIHHFQCSLPCCNDIWDASDIEVEVNEEIFEAQIPYPQCNRCSNIARPNILMFGDWTWISNRTRIQGEKLARWLENIKNNNFSLAIIEIGAGEAVPTVRNTSENVAFKYMGKLIRINPRDSDVPTGHIGIESGALEAIEKIYEFL
jgi:NAD-dependent SIR2 family protein deacetylase